MYPGLRRENRADEERRWRQFMQGGHDGPRRPRPDMGNFTQYGSGAVGPGDYGHIFNGPYGRILNQNHGGQGAGLYGQRPEYQMSAGIGGLYPHLMKFPPPRR